MFQQKVDNQASPEAIHIPKNIQKDIQERGFHLYRWISPQEVKLSIERDFLKTLKILWIPLAIISVMFALISGLNVYVFFFTIISWVFLIFLYLLFLSIHRSRLLSKSAFVVMTDSSISLGWKIHKLSEISQLKTDISKVSEIFEEGLFEESWLSHSKKSLSEEVMKQLFWWYKALFSMADNKSFGRTKDSAQWMLVIIALYTAYVAIMACVYFFWVLFLLFFWKLITWINSQYLVVRWHSVIKINHLFWKLDISSQKIKEQKSSIKKLLSNALQNDWKDGLLLEINAGIKDINTSAESSVWEVLELRKLITSSQYNNMFDFKTYNSWIKKQISTPLEDILSLLKKNQNILLKTQEDITKQVWASSKIENKSALKLQLKRLKIQLKEIKKYIPMLESSINKLR